MEQNIHKTIKTMEIKIKLNSVDLDVLDSATQKDFTPSVSLMALCGDIIVTAYKKQTGR